MLQSNNKCISSPNDDHAIDIWTSIFTVSGPPDPVTDCSSGEPDPFIVMLSCRPGYDGGLTSSYTAQLYTDPEHTVLQSTVTNTRPVFSVYNLPPGTR